MGTENMESFKFYFLAYGSCVYINVINKRS